MTKTALLLLSATPVALGSAATSFSDPQTRSSTAEWYLIDEIIEDRPPDYRSEIYFADKASIEAKENQLSLRISKILLTDDQSQRFEENIRDMRAEMAVDCQSRTYQLSNLSFFDGTEQRLKPPEWRESEQVPTSSPTGFDAIVRFACETDNNFGKRQSPANMQPLTWLIAFFNADWSK